MPRKRMRQFIREHRSEIDAIIDQCRNRWRENNPIEHPPYDDEDRRQWVLNDEGLYLWARSEGVRV